MKIRQEASQPQSLGVLQLKELLQLQKDGVEHDQRTAQVKAEVLF